MSKGFIQIRRGLEEHLLAGLIGLFEAGVYLLIHLQVDFQTGIWTGSAPRLLAAAPRGATLRDVQRALARLEEIGFLRIFHQQGQRGNYRVLINKYEPQSAGLKGQRLNADASTCWRKPVYESCAEPDTDKKFPRSAALTMTPINPAEPIACESMIGGACAESDTEAAPYLKEERKTKREAAPVRPSQDTRSALVPQVENGERQFTGQLKKLARDKSLPGNGRPTEPLRAELYDGIFRKKIENVFFDLRGESFAGQLRGCVREATTYLVLNRTGKTMELRAEDIEKRAIRKLEAAPQGLAAMQAVQDGPSRAVLISRLVARIVADAAAELLEGSERPTFSAAREREVEAIPA